MVIAEYYLHLITFSQPEEIPPHIYPLALPDYLTGSTGNSPVAKYIESYVNRSVPVSVIHDVMNNIPRSGNAGYYFKFMIFLYHKCKAFDIITCNAMFPNYIMAILLSCIIHNYILYNIDYAFMLFFNNNDFSMRQMPSALMSIIT